MMSLTSLVVLFGIFSVSQASTCSCNGNISNKGSGECRTTHNGLAFCYVEKGSCADEKESSQSGWFWSNQACETGTTPTLLESDVLSAGARLGASVTQGDCACTEHTETDHRGQQIGKCLSRFNGVTWCYVKSDSNCGDKKQSSKNPALLWSHLACQTNADSDSISTEERIRKNEERLRTKRIITATDSRRGSDSNCLTSPGHPNKYPQNSAPEEQIIRVPDGHHIEITFQHFDVESCWWCSENKCRWDWVEIKERTRGKNVVKKLCGDSLPAPFTIPSSTATVSFHSDYVVERTGYKICYKSKKQQPASAPVLLHTDIRYNYYKIPVAESAKMTTATVLATCSNNGMKPQCYRFDYADDNCIHAPREHVVSGTDGSVGYIMSDIMCNTKSKSPQNCEHTVNMFWYMAKNWLSGSACGATTGRGYCTRGYNLISTKKLQYFAACLKAI